MSSLIHSLRTEIARVARKELKEELLALRKVTTAHRSEIAALKRQVKSLASAIKTVSKTSKARKQATEVTDEPATPGLRFSPARLVAIRTKLGVSQAEFGLLVEASYQSVHKWEADKAKPRATQLKKIALVAKHGKREVQKRLQAMQSQ